MNPTAEPPPPPAFPIASTLALLPDRALILPLAGTLALGATGDLLLRAAPWGINAGIWTAILATSAILWARELRLPLARLWMLLPALLFSFFLSWRDSSTLNNLSLAGVAASLLFAVIRVSGTPLKNCYLVEFGEWAGRVLAQCLSGTPLLVRRWMGDEKDGGAPALKAIAPYWRGFLLSIPFLVIFGALLISADKLFQNFIVDWLSFDVRTAWSHLLLFMVCGWFGGGYLMALLSASRRGADNEERRHNSALRGTLGAIEVNTVLSTLNILFLTFVAVQFQYLFSGGNWVESTPGLSLAEYARRGFFELAAVAGLVLPLLLAADYVIAGASRWFRILSLSLIGLLFVIIASALLRMQLYWQHFGLTELRVYVTAFMLWMAAMFVWFIVTVQRGRRRRFSLGVVWSGFAAILALHAVNPDRFIAETNLQRHREGQPLDLNYLLTLSADSRPPLIEALPLLTEDQRDIILEQISMERLRIEASDWRSWNLSRATLAPSRRPNDRR